MQLMKNTIYINRMQELITDLTGQLKHSNNTILNLNPGVNIFDIFLPGHSFFSDLLTGCKFVDRLHTKK